MSISKETQMHTDKREELNPLEAHIINNVFVELYSSSLGKAFPKDDRAAELEAALIKFILYTRKESK